MQLVFGAGILDRVVDDADKLLLRYRLDPGYSYLDYQPRSSPDQLVPEDLAVTLMVNSQPTGAAHTSIQRFGPSLNLAQLPRKPFERTTQAERTQLAAVIAHVAKWPGIKASIATKVLHKKRPSLIPILDNEAIFGAYLNPNWPQRRPSGQSEDRQRRIEQALNCIATDLTREENAAAWPQLSAIEPRRTLIQIFDSVWWMFYVGVRRRSRQPQPEIVLV
jgi:hypothetical protein